MTELSGPPPVLRIVLIEDDPLVVFGQEMLLRDWGYRVVAGTSHQALRLALKDAPSDVAAIIADYNLGGEVTGADVARAVAADAKRPIPTVVLSASLGQRSGAAAALHGFTLLDKPIDPEALRDWLVMATATPN